MTGGARAAAAAGAALVSAAALLSACGPAARTSDPVCAAYLRFNDAIAEAHDVSDLRRAASALESALPQGAGGPVATSKAALAAAVRQQPTSAQVYFDAAAGVAEHCQYAQPE